VDCFCGGSEHEEQREQPHESETLRVSKIQDSTAQFGAEEREAD
jgi:hypothetical protein